MPRPRKCRKVCCLPNSNEFGPLNTHMQHQAIVMSIEEYEVVRLIDLQDFSQEQAAESMHVARTTVQRIYNDARKKIADCIVNSKQLKIYGGDYRLCDGKEESCNCGGCRKHRQV